MPDKPYSGQFVTRISPELHRQVNVAASLAGKSLNAWVADQLKRAVGGLGIPSGVKSAKRKGRRPAWAKKHAG